VTDPRPENDKDELQVIGRGGGRVLTVPAIVVVIGLLLAIFKPWGGALPQIPDDGSSSGVAASSNPAGSVRAATPDLETASARELERMCASPSGWRVSTLQLWTGRTRPIRSWAVVDPVEASGPTDRRIPIIPVAADRISAIGYCAPESGDDLPPVDATAALFSVDAEGAHLLTAVRLEPRAETSMGVLWAPNPRTGRRDPISRRSWPDGVYVIHMSDPSGSFDRWLGAELRITRGE
jgi:hypothetical protein